jgi:hypothetical protein
MADVRGESMTREGKEDKLKETVELTSKLSGKLGVIEKLIKCSTTYYEDDSPYPGGQGFH